MAAVEKCGLRSMVRGSSGRFSASRIGALGAFLISCSVATTAQSWTEVGDAPSLPPGQQIAGFGSLWQINGALTSTSDVDLYAIQISSPGSFYASTVSGATFDTQLFLFDINGFGVTHNDDYSATIGQSQITGQFVPNPGVYLLAVSRWDRDPVTAANQQIWNDAPFETERAPDGPGAAGAISNWIGASGGGTYIVFLNGAEFIPPPFGACCVDGFCYPMYESDCQTWAGTFLGDQTSCSGDPCNIPANNECGDAINVGAGYTSFSNVSATTDGPVACGQLARDVWFRCHVPCCATVTVTTCGTAGWDTVLAAYEDGCTPTLANLRACNDDTCDLQSEISFDIPGGEYFLLQVAGYQGASGMGDVYIQIDCTNPPQIIQHPVWQPVETGGTAAFSVVATGTPPLTYEWYRAGQIVATTTQPSITIPNVQTPDEGPYYTYVYDTCDRLVRSHSADLDVYPHCMPPIAEPGGCYIPDVWKLDPIPWNRDVAPQNKIDDLIDANPGVRYDIIVDFRECVTPGHLQFLENISPQSSVQEPFSVINSVAMRNVLLAEALTIAAHTGVALIEKQVDFATDLDISLQSTRVMGPEYSPDTVDDAFGLSGDGFNIAIMDTGVDDVLHDTFATDPFIFIAGYHALTDAEINPDDDMGHGTHVASIALGRGGVSVWRGMAPKAGLIDVKVIDPGDVVGPAATFKIMKGLQKLIEKQHDWNVHIINMSLHSTEESNGVESFSQMVDRAVRHGIVVIAAAGNFFPEAVTRPPARAARAIAVAASSDSPTPATGDPADRTADRADDVIAPFSNAGPAIDNGNTDGYDELKPEIAAPGFLIFGALSDDPLSAGFYASGTSMAAPHVAGIAALILQAKPSLNPESLRAVLINKAERKGVASPAGVGFSPPGWNDRWGWGLVDAYAATERQIAAAQTDVTFGTMPAGTPWANQNIGPETFPPKCGVLNRMFAVVKNNGPADAFDVRVEFGVYDFFGSLPPYNYVATSVIPTLLAGASTTVYVDWTPDCVTLNAHQCMFVEIGCDNDLNPGNNVAQMNLDITASPVYFQLANYVNTSPITVEFFATTEPPSAGWGIQITPPIITIGPDDNPPTIEVLPVPPPTANDGDSIIIHVESRTTTGQCLGGVSIMAVMRDCDDNGIDDWFQVQAGAPPWCDVNCDGTVNPFDIQPFLDLLGPTPPPPCSGCAGDTNRNGTVNPFDIQAFLDCL